MTNVLRFVLESLGPSWRRHRRFLLAAWIAGLAVCVYMAWAGGGMYFYMDFRENGRRWAGLMSLASGFCLMSFAWSLLVVARRTASREGWGSTARAWLMGSLGGTWLAFDEVAQLHESLVRVMERRHVPLFLGFIDRDAYLFAAYAVAAGLIVWLLRAPLARRRDLALPVLMSIFFFAASELIDEFPIGPLASHNMANAIGAAEEILKTMGSWTLALLGLLFSDAGADGEAPRSS